MRLATVMNHFDRRHIGGATKRSIGTPLTLRLFGGATIETDIVGDKKMFRWRGWKPWFEQCGLSAGDRLRFTPRGGSIYDVRPVRSE
ncbi:MAG: hypothetical protein GC162_18500 [Planctomycetes bacterium]|nr:hypothetical protein [Planctomycetota bacterium]